MKFERNPQHERELLGILRAEYLTERKEIPHLSELLYCLTKSWYNRFEPLQPTDDELLLFAVGFGLERVLLRREQKMVQLDGIYLTPDFITLDDIGLDLKSTRMYPGTSGIPKMGWPEGWLRQFMAYAHVLDSRLFSVAILYLKEPALVVGTFLFTPEEMDENWNWLDTRKKVYLDSIMAGKEPIPFKWNQDWECRGCRYNFRCKARSQLTTTGAETATMSGVREE